MIVGSLALPQREPAQPHERSHGFFQTYVPAYITRGKDRQSIDLPVGYVDATQSGLNDRNLARFTALHAQR